MSLTFSSQVSTESLYGTNLSFFLPADWSARADITNPKVVRDLKNKKNKIIVADNHRGLLRFLELL